MTDFDENTKLDRPHYIIKTKSVRDILEDLRKAELWLLIAAVAAFLASAFFVVKYFVGGEMTPETWTGEQWMNAGLGLGITAVITAAQAFLYAGGYKGQAAIIATFIVVFFGLFSEISQSMEREDATVRHRSENSAVFQAALQNINNLSTDLTQVAPQQQALADAKAHLNYWTGLKEQKNENQASIKYTHRTIDRNISQYKQEVSTLQHQVGMLNNNRNLLLSNAIQQAKALEYDEDKHYAMIRLIQHGLGVTGIWASFLFSIIIIGTFEYAFHFVGSYVADHKKALLLIGRDTQGNPIQSAEMEVAASQSNIPRDYANQLREEYLDWVNPERTQPPSANKAQKNADLEPDSLSDKAAFLVKQQRHTKNIEESSTAEEIATKTSAPSSQQSGDLTQERIFKAILAKVRQRIIYGEIRPTVRPVTDAVTDVIKQQAHILGMKPSTMGKPQRQKIAEAILKKLAQEKVIIPNKEGGVGKPKYILSGKYQTMLDDTILNKMEQEEVFKPATT